MRKTPFIVALIVFLAALPSFADSWMPPTTQAYFSADRRVRFTVTPREVSNPLAYFEDKVKGEEPAGQNPGSAQTAAVGVLERQNEAGAWSLLWKRTLLNEVAPVTALVSNSGNYAVTFDNWHRIGREENVVVIYGPQGKLIRSLSLENILPAPYIKALPRSVSSTRWGGKHFIVEATDTLILKVVVPSEDWTGRTESTYFDLPVSLSTGKVLSPAAQPWKDAQAQAERVNQQNDAAEAATERELSSPLLAPQSNDETAWHHYLNEAYYRIHARWQEDYPRVKVLRSPDAPDYAKSVEWLREGLADSYAGDVVMIASPASASNLVKVLSEIIRGLKPNALKSVIVYVVGPREFKQRIAEALAPSGADFVHIDPKTPLPPNQERLKRFRGEAD